MRWSKVYEVHFKSLGKGVYYDLKGRIPFLKSDFMDGFTNYRTVPSIVYIFFTNLLPAIAFAQDMFDKTNNSYGVNEVLLSSAMAGVVFGLFSGQPLCIVGVTGPISIFNYTVYDLIDDKSIYFQFMCWICLWSMVFHFILLLTNTVNYLRYVTRFSCDIFGFFINIIYIQKGIQILSRQFNTGIPEGFASVMVSLLMLITGVLLQLIGSNSRFFKPVIRKVLQDYSTPLSIIFFTGFIHFGGYLDDVTLEKLPITRSFHPTSHLRPDDWFIRFYRDIPVGDVFLAIPFAILLTCLFYFDHNISSLICQGDEFPLQKPASFHWDFFLLGITTGVSGLIGIPAPNGLIPQAPLHTQSLCVTEHDLQKGHHTISRVVEQRVTNIAQGLLILVMMTRPFLVVLGTIPQCVLAGLFWIIAIGGLQGNAIVDKLKFICTDKESLKFTENETYKTFLQVIPKWFYLFTLLELLVAGAEIAITQTKGAVAFPAVLLFGAALAMYFPRIFPPSQLELLDSATASDYTMQNLRVGEESQNRLIS